MRRLLIPVLAGVTALGLLVAGGIVGRHRPAPPVPVAAAATPVDALGTAIDRAQQRLRNLPEDWRTWAALGTAYVERARVTADPTYYPKAEGAVRQSLALRPNDNADALVASGALANARHDFATARDAALRALAVNAYDADAYGVLADARTQLGDPAGATDAVQHMLDLRPGLAAYARASYDLEQRGRDAEAGDLMRQALAAAVDPHDIAFCRNQLGDLAWAHGDLAGASAQYAAGLTADPESVALQRGQARIALAQGRTDAALTGYAKVTGRAPLPSYFLEYADALRAGGRIADADAQVRLAATADALFRANGGTDDLATAAIALAEGRTADAVAAALREWQRRRFADVADTLAWALHAAGRDAEALPYAQQATATGNHSAAYAYHLGAIELGAGLVTQGRADLVRALATNPSFSPVEAPMARTLLARTGA
jgi:Flp pilus assembly protein TadD